MRAGPFRPGAFPRLILLISGEDAIVDNKQRDCDRDNSQNCQEKHGRVLLLKQKGKSQQFEEDGIYKPHNCHGMIITLNILHLGRRYDSHSGKS